MALEVTSKANSDGTLSFKTRDGKYLSAWPDAPHLRLMPHNQDWEHWDLQAVLCDGMWYSLKSRHFGRYLCSGNDGCTFALQPKADTWERFALE
ncbi:hypothetical protein HYH03_014085 [Edaphochlamys debaryana]|nr:hypothetical protein HYH03_014085 [Edaphochlamys debaryana]|eukprot:KAG2487243.1 hypothetical protein HYH03_014085 [Edaphochlamys debaryana]